VHRLEVTAALSSDVPVIPVLIRGASHPSELRYLQSLPLDEVTWDQDVERLADLLDDVRRHMRAEREQAAAEARIGRREVSRAYVFVSYAREDQKYVKRLVNHLNRLKVDTWTDDGIDHGTRWTAVIRDASTTVPPSWW
jgi:hypothetical protein